MQMRQAIQARYYGATNFRGARIKVWAQAGVRWYPFAYEQNDGGKEAYILEYAREKGWVGPSTAVVYGVLPCGDTVGVLVEA